MAGMAIYNAGADAIARLADLATNDQRSSLYGAVRLVPDIETNARRRQGIL